MLSKQMNNNKVAALNECTSYDFDQIFSFMTVICIFLLSILMNTLIHCGCINKPDVNMTITFKDIVRENELFDKFYRAQNFCSDEDFDKMMAVFKTDLPTSFR